MSKKCRFCFTDAGDQKCSKCGGAACDRHRDDNGICPQVSAHEAPKPKTTPTPAPTPAHDDDSTPKPRVKVTKPKS